jgi:predicted transcriptional regulator
MSITLDPELEERVLRSARLTGNALDAEVARLVNESLTWEERDRQEAIEGIQRGLEDVAAGRVKPISATFTALEEKYGFASE